VSRILDGAGRELIGYTDPWSAHAGQRVELMVSTTEPTFDVRLVRLRHGDPNPAGPGFRATPVPSGVDGTHPGAVQTIRSGSYGVIEDDVASRTLGGWAWPTRPDAGREQVLFQRGGLTVLIDADGRPSARAGDLEVRGERLARERWTFLKAALGEDRLSLTVGDETFSADGACAPATGPIHLAADADGGRCYDGRLEEPFADRTWDLRAARLVNAPTVAVAGRRFQDDTTDFRAAPDQYAAVHFHSDDLEDAGWEASCALQVPADLASGAYAFELTAGDLTDHVPFVVRPAAGQPSAPVALLLPTMTYQVYGNERLVAGGEGGMAPTAGREFALDPADHWLAAHPEAGASCYDLHPDGHGVSLVSMLRPIPNLRPSFVWWVTEAPERFGSDLYVVDWLEELGQPHDVFTDHDLHADGAALLDGYRVLITGTHPEYWSRQMLDALQGWLERGGRLMYLGGNGFYWVTSIDPDRPHLAEVRRGINGTRAWSSRPGELRHQTTGEQGGLWRYRGRDPNRLVGVGFASQCDTTDRAPGYRRTTASHADEHAWIFEGVDTEMIGEHGLYLGGAAGYEIDRHDPAFGSPAEAVVLATSAGLHPPAYLLVVEDLMVTIPEITGPTTDRVRADLTYLPYPGGGAVFAVGSCSWCGSLSTGGYDNDIARITGNVLRGFLR
jgi:N,N-dimethylformamidase